MPSKKKNVQTQRRIERESLPSYYVNLGQRVKAALEATATNASNRSGR
jgi:hypothetical protein